jgi:hypothetical protein
MEAKVMAIELEQRLGASSEDYLPVPVEGGRSLTTAQRRDVDYSKRIAGWGSDLDPANRPGVPRDGAPEIGYESLYADMPQQEPPFRIHKSTEHRRLTPVFGTSCPPRGVSGRLRDAAYHYSEGRLARWLTLMLADRVDVVEDLVEDLSSGRVPNVIGEMGLAAEWRYNRAALVRKAIVTGVVFGLIVAVRRSRRRAR